MGASLMESHRITDEGLLVVKVCCRRERFNLGNDFKLDIILLLVVANYVPAAAARHKRQALFDIIKA